VAEPLDVVVETHSEFQINDAIDGGIELVQFGQRRILWRKVVPTAQFLEALEKYRARGKSATS
jgi:hypothetical protein